ncbi:AraC-like DNA-binding protein [Bradyrhizobium sp. i1.7.7]
MNSIAPRVFRFSDVDEFRNAIRGLNFEFTPFVRRISAEQTILSLPGCDVNFTRAFPRVVDAQLVENCTAIGFTMDELNVPIRFNGSQRARPVIVIGSGGAAYTTIEEVERQIASVVFRPEVTDRGWPHATSSFKIFETTAASLNRLRSLVREVLAAASEPIGGADVPLKAAAMKESLLGAVDDAFESVVAARWTLRPNDERNFRIFREIRALLSDDLSQPIYSEEIARKLNLSVRTLHDVVRALSRHEPASLFAPAPVVAGASAPARRCRQRQGRRTGVRLLASQRLLQKLSRPVRRDAVANAGARTTTVARQIG